MKDYHSLFYYLVLSPLQELKGSGGSLSDQYRRKDDSPSFAVGFEPREDRYEHNYLRDTFLVERSKIVIGSRAGDENYEDSVIILQEDRVNESVVVYKKAIERIFEKEWQEALKELVELLKKFYSVTVEERSPHQAVDFSNNRSPMQYYINYDL